MLKWFDRFAVVGIAVGLALILWPGKGASFGLGFFVTAVFTIAHIITSHLAGYSEEVEQRNGASDET